MGERTSYPPGTFSWVDLGTTDADGAKVFYGNLLGWEFEDMPVADADATAARAAELGATVISQPFDVLEAGRMAVLQDPTGAVFAIWQPRQSIGAQLVNDAGALTMNQLNTSDPGT